MNSSDDTIMTRIARAEEAHVNARHDYITYIAATRGSGSGNEAIRLLWRSRLIAAHSELVDAKNEIGECHHIGCRVIDPQYSYCSTHRIDDQTHLTRIETAEAEYTKARELAAAARRELRRLKITHGECLEKGHRVTGPLDSDQFCEQHEHP